MRITFCCEICMINHLRGFIFQSPVTLDFIKTKRELCYPITFPMSAPTADGGAAAIVCSEDFVNKHNLQVKYAVTDMYHTYPSTYTYMYG